MARLALVVLAAAGLVLVVDAAMGKWTALAGDLIVAAVILSCVALAAAFNRRRG